METPTAAPTVGKADEKPFPLQSRWERLPLTLLDAHPLARAHSENALASLGQKMRQEGQLQNIVICPKGDGRYEVLAGAGRVGQARSQGWEKVMACIREGLTESQKLQIMLSENEEREAENPIHIGVVYKAMMDAEHLTQEELAKKLGISQQVVQQYLSLLGLPEAIRENTNRFVNLGLRHYLQLLRLSSPEQQVQMAEDCVRNEWPVKELTAQVNKLASKKSGKKPKTGGKKDDIPAPDPLEGVWESIKAKTDGWTWDVEHRFGLAWEYDISLEPLLPDNPRKFLGQWHLAMAAALGETLPDPKIVEQVKALADYPNALARAAKDTSVPAFRLPKTPQEQSELESLALQGPGPVFQWIYGPGSEQAKEAEGKTWQDAGSPDPVAGVRDLVETLRDVQDIRGMLKKK